MTRIQVAVKNWRNWSHHCLPVSSERKSSPFFPSSWSELHFSPSRLWSPPRLPSCWPSCAPSVAKEVQEVQEVQVSVVSSERSLDSQVVSVDSQVDSQVETQAEHRKLIESWWLIEWKFAKTTTNLVLLSHAQICWFNWSRILAGLTGMVVGCRQQPIPICSFIRWGPGPRLPWTSLNRINSTLKPQVSHKSSAIHLNWNFYQRLIS